jgi:hypothetical protein
MAMCPDSVLVARIPWKPIRLALLPNRSKLAIGRTKGRYAMSRLVWLACVGLVVASPLSAQKLKFRDTLSP